MNLLFDFQYPKGLGSTVSEIDVSNAKVFPKTVFSMYTPDVQEHLKTLPNTKTIVLFGIEVCDFRFYDISNLLRCSWDEWRCDKMLRFSYETLSSGTDSTLLVHYNCGTANEDNRHFLLHSGIYLHGKLSEFLYLDFHNLDDDLFCSVLLYGSAEFPHIISRMNLELW